MFFCLLKKFISTPDFCDTVTCEYVIYLISDVVMGERTKGRTALLYLSVWQIQYSLVSWFRSRI